MIGSRALRWLGQWLGREPAEALAGHGQGAQRWVVLDVETSGLDQSSDRLMSIGAVAVHDRRIVVADSLEVTIRQPSASERHNILVHGIGAEAQLSGLDPKEACRQFLDYAGRSPLVAFHAAFDRAFLMRAARAFLGVPIGNAWIDLADLAPALHPGTGARALDDWLAHFGIPVDQRHNAAGDAFATAMLFLRLLASVPPAERRPRQLQRLAAHARWVAR
ncbi:MAG TPA: 3'-5' exonuclease [Burkholderiaceae bacterium]|nr:3'-5' exonuclease [Burkholderiaceae bacterium]